MTQPTQPRFLTVPQVAEELTTSQAQILALIRRRELVAIRIGGRGQWRGERSKLEEYIARCYDETDRRLRGGEVDPAADDPGGDSGDDGGESSI